MVDNIKSSRQVEEDQGPRHTLGQRQVYLILNVQHGSFCRVSSFVGRLKCVTKKKPYCVTTEMLLLCHDGLPQTENQLSKR